MASSRDGLLLAGRYRLGPALGTGGMADVYDGVDERLRRPVAVKILRPEMAVRADVRQRFEAEARSAASLTHPNVVGVFDSGEDGEVPYLVMEKLPGETLADRMREGPLETGWILRVAGDVLGALGAAHAAGIVHRDVKPGNVLIAADSCAKVADFGIAKSLEVAAAADLTGTNQLVGTPAYVAPERILGQPATVQSDLYAVGVLLYEALAGTKPFAGDTPVATAYAIQHETPPSLARLRPDLPAGLVLAVERAMARDPQERFSSAAEMAAALGIAAAGATAIAATAAGDDATVVAAVDATAVLPGVATATPGPDPAPPPEVDALRPPPPLLRDRRRLLLIAGAALALALVLLGIAAASGGGAPPNAARAELAAALRDAGDDLEEGRDGAAAGEAADALDGLADVVEEGGGGPEATTLLGRLASWRDAGRLTGEAVAGIAGVVGRVPGVDATALVPPTTTAAPPPPEEDRADDDEGGAGDREDDGNSKGKGRGKGKGDD